MCTSITSCCSLFSYGLLIQEDFRYHSILLDYYSFYSLYSGLNKCFQGRHPKQTEFSEKETKLTFIPLQKAFLGAPVRGTSHDVHYQESHPNVKTSLHRVLSNLSNKLQFLAHETGEMGEWWGDKKQSQNNYILLHDLEIEHVFVKIK